MIKILLIHTRNIFAQEGASSNRWRTLVEGLAKEGAEIEIIIAQGYSSLSEIRKYGWSGKIGNIAYSYCSFLLHNSIWMRRISRYLLMPLFKSVNIALFKRKVNQTEPHIIFLHPSLEVFDIYLGSLRKSGLPLHKLMIEISEFDDIGLINSTNSLQLKNSKRFSKVLLTEILPRTDFLVVMTRHLLEYYRQFTDNARVKCLHLPMTVDLKRFEFKKGQVSTERYIAYCGSSSFAKDGIDILLKSFSLISGKYPFLKLKIAAFMQIDGGRMLELIQVLNLQEKVVYLGGLKRDEIPDFLSNAELLLLPRPDSKQARGGFPTKLGEYLATGNPVCATTVGEIPDYLIDNESIFFAEPGNVESFSTAMDRALSDPVNALRVGANGKRVAELNFNMDIQSGKLFSFLTENLNPV